MAKDSMRMMFYREETATRPRIIPRMLFLSSGNRYAATAHPIRAALFER